MYRSPWQYHIRGFDMTWSISQAERAIPTTVQSVCMGSAMVFLIAAGLRVALGAAAGGTLSVWIAGVVSFAVIVWVAIRPVIQKLEHRHTEAKLLKDVRRYFQNSEPLADAPSHSAAIPDVPQSRTFLSSATACCDFAKLDRLLSPRMADGDLVVFDAIPARRRDCQPGAAGLYAILDPIPVR